MKETELDELGKALMQFFREKQLRIYVASLSEKEPDRDFEGEVLAAHDLSQSIKNIAGMVIKEESTRKKKNSVFKPGLIS